jgi:WD40 repeat protein/tRNA A-37 threonylcarbamoyl transferase component Bud32
LSVLEGKRRTKERTNVAVNSMSEPGQSLEEFLFEGALAKSSDTERAAFLEGVCRNNPALRARLDMLLEGHFQAEGFLDSGKKQSEQKPPLPPTHQEWASVFIGRYKLLEKIGEGGFGEVWMAEQKEPVKRRVALKIIKLGMDTKQVVARFEAERQALAMMDHPKIAKVLDGGATDSGRPYFVMELVRGVRITDYCEQNKLSTHERLNLFIQVCRAIQHAHQKGIIHRDIKPSNILVTMNDGLPVPKVIDFGIAKATQMELTEKTVFTQFQQFLGTPAYVSPEQASMSSLDVDTRSDIYSLGVLLYELLTGTTPFDTQELLRAGLEGMRQIICEREPLRPSTRVTQKLSANQTEATTQSKFKNQNSKIESDLDWIVMKCLEKERGRRYETANGLAHDLERHLKNEPVLARPPSRLYEFQKSVRRHWVGFATIGAILAALAIGVVASTSEAVRARRAERYGERLLYAARMKLAQRNWELNNIVRVRQLLAETADYPDRGFEWYYWQRQVHLALHTLRGHLDEIWGGGFSPDGQKVVTCSKDRTAIVWDVPTGREVVVLKGHLEGISWAAFSPDGQRIVTASKDETAKVWDANEGKELLTLSGHHGDVYWATFSPDGKQIATCAEDRTARIWDAVTGKPVRTLPGYNGAVLCVVFSPNSQRIITTSRDTTAVVWDAVSGKELFVLTGHTAAINVACFSPDGRRIVTASNDHKAKVWDAATGKELLTFSGHNGPVNDAEFSPNGQRLISGSDDATAKVWETATGKELFTIKGHEGSVEAAAFSPDGRRIFTASKDQTAKIWDAAGDKEPLSLKGHEGEVICIDISPDSRRVLTGSGDLTAKVWDIVTGKVLFTLRGHHRAVRCAVFSPDGQRIVTGSGDHKAKAWDAASGTFLFDFSGHRGPITSLAFSRDSQRVITACADRTAKIWDAGSGRCLVTLEGHSNAVFDVDFSPARQRVVTASVDGTARVWDATSGKCLLSFNQHSGDVNSVNFSPDGKWIVTGSEDRTARVWNAASGKPLLTLEGHSDGVACATFSADGRRMVTGSRDRTAKLWDAASGEELLTLKTGDYDSAANISHDGRRMVASANDNTVNIWEAATPEQVATWQREEQNAAERLETLRREAANAAERERATHKLDPGMIRQWLLLAPISIERTNGAKALAEEQIPGEANLRAREGEPIQVDGSEMVWQAVQLDDYMIDFNRVVGANAPWSVAYAICYVKSAEMQTGLSMKVGSHDQAKVYLNGKEIYHQVWTRSCVPDQDTVENVTLKRGLNVLVFKVINEGGDMAGEWRGSVRLTDGAGKPVKGIGVTLEPEK